MIVSVTLTRQAVTRDHVTNRRKFAPTEKFQRACHAPAMMVFLSATAQQYASIQAWRQLLVLEESAVLMVVPPHAPTNRRNKKVTVTLSYIGSSNCHLSPGRPIQYELI